MPSGNVIRGARVGSAPMRPDERHQPAPRQDVTYWCRNDHRVDIRIAADVEPPAQWDCPRCGLPAGPDAQNPPGRARAEPYKSHLAYVKERRTAEEGEALLNEALAALRRRRGE
ncbi:RNA polymerase-binding protein RbpA [Micromonospora sp. M51]|uniref:RNA polymerase-binding protein RbpA n=1 Tax=Micromonospora parva TaxID=1464048 RepID=A0ABW6VL91_9ACTN|nr:MULTISPECIES: RNA polymerase-binding protein RbpA [Micromonospora]MBQ1015486.1 RNA polymerase-binding protein RbpA [Micromonospora sp. M51]MBQ1033783.1 RNA polymerase-binding protein RbpA [Micromonospora sp. C97]